MTTLNIYQKLSNAREEFHATKIEKTGWNSFSKYKYFELSDFLVPALGILKKHGLLTLPVTFDNELAKMSLVSIDDDSQAISFTSPMRDVKLKACHEIQNLGAVETYQRRYLWTSLLEIVEHDAVDSSAGPVDEPKAPELATHDQKVAIDVHIANGTIPARTHEWLKNQKQLTSNQADKVLGVCRTMAKEQAENPE